LLVVADVGVDAVGAEDVDVAVEFADTAGRFVPFGAEDEDSSALG